MSICLNIGGFTTPRPKTKAKQKADFNARQHPNGTSINPTSVSPDQWAKLEALAEVSKQERKKLDDRGIEGGLTGSAFQAAENFELQDQFTIGNQAATFEQGQNGDKDSNGMFALYPGFPVGHYGS